MTDRDAALGLRKCTAIGLSLVMVFVTSGCSLLHLPSEPRGEILVGQPEVFTRQRLVNRRLTEQQWLEEELRKNTPTTQVLQGYRDVREFSGIYSKIGATFDPLGGAVSAAQSQLALQNLKNQTEVAELQRRLDLLVLHQKLAAQQQTPLTGATRSVATPQATTTSPPPAPPSPGAPTPTPSGIFSNPPALPSPADVVETKAKVSSIELLRDQLAWRNAIQAALREQELDDSHDLDGYTLYTLKFDISVLVPAGGNTAYAKVQLGEATPVTPKSAAEDPKRAELRTKYDTWLWHLRAAVRKEAVALQRRFELEFLSEEEKIRIATAARVWADKPDTSAVISAFTKLLGFIMNPKSLQAEESSAAKADAKGAAARLVGEKYRVALVGLIDVCAKPIEILLDESAYYIPNIRAPKDVDAKNACPEAVTRTENQTLNLFEEKLKRDTKVTVFVADPKEEAQNVSDVAATEQLRNIVFSLQALIPQSGVTANTYNEYLNRSQQRLQAILRRPLVVAYSDGKKFGWIVGPRFELDRQGKPVFNQTTVQRSVQVSLVVPGATQKLKIPYQTCWLRRNGTESCDTTPKSFEISLPGDDAAITARLLADTGTRRLPYVEPPINPRNQRQVYRLQANHPGDLLIRGDNLWRNPAVFIGAQPAETVKVLPDMSGLRVRIDKVVMPPAKPKENPFVDLTVVTSEGIAVLREAIQIVPEGAFPAEKFVVGMESARVVNADTGRKAPPLVLAAPLETVPDGFSKITFALRPVLPGEDPAKVTRQFYPLSGEVSLSKRDKKMLFLSPVSLTELKKSSNPMPGTSGWVMQVEPRLAGTPGASLVPIPSSDGKPLLFSLFPDEKSSHGALSIRGAASAPPPVTTFNALNDFTATIVVALGDGNVFAQAYPGLKQAIQSILTLRIAETSNGAEVGSIRAALDARHFELATGRPPTDQTPPIIIKSLPGSQAARGQGQQPEQTGASAWLRQRLTGGKEHTFKLSLIVAPDIEVPVGPEVRIKLP